MDIEYKLGESMRIRLSADDLGSLATRGYCTLRNGLVGTESKTWIRHGEDKQNPSAVIDGGPDLNVDIPPDQQFPFTVTRNAISALNGDEAMVDWFFHEDSEIVVE